MRLCPWRTLLLLGLLLFAAIVEFAAAQTECSPANCGSGLRRTATTTCAGVCTTDECCEVAPSRPAARVEAYKAASSPATVRVLLVVDRDFKHELLIGTAGATWSAQFRDDVASLASIQPTTLNMTAVYDGTAVGSGAPPLLPCCRTLVVIDVAAPPSSAATPTLRTADDAARSLQRAAHTGALAAATTTTGAQYVDAVSIVVGACGLPGSLAFTRALCVAASTTGEFAVDGCLLDPQNVGLERHDHGSDFGWYPVTMMRLIVGGSIAFVFLVAGAAMGYRFLDRRGE
jgi:hypothetical protein